MSTRKTWFIYFYIDHTNSMFAELDVSDPADNGNTQVVHPSVLIAYYIIIIKQQ